MVFKSLFLQLIVLLLLLSACNKTEPRFEFALGTVCVVNLYEYGNEKIYNDIFSRIREIENLMSLNIPSSDISKINASAGIEPIHVHKDTFFVLERAIYFAELSDGAFDPTIGPLVSLWGINNTGNYVVKTDIPRVPYIEEINQILPLVNWRNIEMDVVNQTVYLKQHGMSLDLGAIAKGYAADEVLSIVKNANVKRALIDLGGNVIVFGEKIDRSPWRVGIQNPHNERGVSIGYLQIPGTSAEHEVRRFPSGKTIVTSGVYERFFIEDGIRYHHIFDPSNGYPVNNGLLSVTLITDISMDADALSTAIFVLGYEMGSSLLKSYPNTDVIFVFADNTLKTTAGLNFTITDKTFKLIN